MKLKKLSSLLILAGLNGAAAFAATPPTPSTPDGEVWYMLQFSNGGCVVEAQADDANVLTADMTGSDAQWWKVEGSDADGYTLTSKTGQKLYTTSTAKEGMFKSSASATQNTTFVWSNSTAPGETENFVLSPKENANVFMNQWGGAGSGKQLGLWNERADKNQPFKFLSEADFEKLDQKLPLIPYPQSIVTNKGTLAVSALTGINYLDEPTERYAREFAEQLETASGHKLNVTAEAQEKGVTMTKDEALAHEAYTLTVNENGIAITAADSAGFFYALQTVKQLLPNAIYGKELKAEADWTLPLVEVADQPRFGHRGFMLDIARHYFSPTEVKRVLDIMASYKLNMFHWHLTDDQGWRIEIPEYPRLTEVGSIRAGSFTNAGGSSKFYDDTEYGRGLWYSLDDLREIVAYAKARNIEILPEIDLPGHMVAAVTAYPEFSCDPSKKYEVRIDGGISKDVLNVGKDEVIDFLKCVLGHVADVFPYPYIHLGGDECPTDQWKNNADCLERVKNEGLEGVHELQSWLVEELGIYLRDEKGKGIVVWDEVLSHWKKTNEIKPVVLAWNHINKSSQAADLGFKSILAPYQNVYIDFMQVPVDKADINEGYQGGWGDGWVNTLQDVYSLNPAGALSGREEYCLGVQGNMWTETCSDSLQLEYQMLPRLLGVSEIGWTNHEAKNWTGFLKRLQSQDEIFDIRGYNYAKHYIENDDTPAEAALGEAEKIIKAARPGQPGHASQADYDAFSNAYTKAAAEPNEENINALAEATKVYKKAGVLQPQEGKFYQIASASTYYKAKYEGSTVYVKDGNLRFHYTPQTEPEELWQFVPAANGYKITNVLTGQQVKMPGANGTNVTLADAGTVMRVDKATKASGTYTYVPGAVTISSTVGYASAPKRFYGDCTGYVKSDANGALCYPGTWYIQEVSDFTAQLAGLVKKGRLILLTTTPGEAGEPSEAALEFLANSIISPADADVKAGNVSEAKYREYLDLYNQYLAMPRTSAAESLSEGYYYRLQNAWFTDYYATATTQGTVAPRKVSDDEAAMWRVKKNTDGTIVIINKLRGQAAYPASAADAATIMLGEEYNWLPVMNTTDEGKTGMLLLDAGRTFSWYTNPSSWPDKVILKPKAWGASIWNFIKLDITTGIETPIGNDAPVRYYDLSGRRVMNPANGVFITNTGKKVVK